MGFLKYITGVEYSGNADYWVNYITHYEPKVGDIIVIDAGYNGHIGVVINVEGDVTVRSRNWRNIWEVSDDRFDKNDSRILGYIDTSGILD